MKIYINGVKSSKEDLQRLEQDLRKGKNRATAKIIKNAVVYSTK